MGALDFVVQLPFSWRQSRARAVREDMTQHKFVSALASDDLEERAAGLLWEKLVEAAVISDFRPKPDDNFLRIYGLAEEDLDEDIVMAILIQLGFGVPRPAVIEQAGEIASPREFMQLVRLTRSATHFGNTEVGGPEPK